MLPAGLSDAAFRLARASIARQDDDQVAFSFEVALGLVMTTGRG
jgi:hypothetical protein